MSYSLNETRALAIKAAHGAGLNWGEAEEAAYATCWLARNGEDACQALNLALKKIDGADRAMISPLQDGTNWEAQDESSALLTGILLADRAGMLSTKNVKIASVDVPLFLCPFIARLSQNWGTNLILRGQHFEAQIAPSELIIEGDYLIGQDVEINEVPSQFEICNLQASRVFARDDDIDALKNWAQRTYAPATEASRLKGAGAGVSDAE